MGCYDEINIKIRGQVENARLVKAELEVVCSKYDLELEDVW